MTNELAVNTATTTQLPAIKRRRLNETYNDWMNRDFALFVSHAMICSSCAHTLFKRRYLWRANVFGSCCHYYLICVWLRVRWNYKNMIDKGMQITCRAQTPLCACVQHGVITIIMLYQWALMRAKHRANEASAQSGVLCVCVHVVSLSMWCVWFQFAFNLQTQNPANESAISNKEPQIIVIVIQWIFAAILVFQIDPRHMFVFLLCVCVCSSLVIPCTYLIIVIVL